MLQQQYAECRESEQTLLALNQMAAGGSRMGASDDSLSSLTRGSVATLALHPSGLDFSRCQNINDQLVVVAQANDGLVETRKATNILWDVYVGAGTFESLFSTVKQRLSSRRTEWKRVGKGTYQYLHYVPTDQMSVNPAIGEGARGPPDTPTGATGAIKNNRQNYLCPLPHQGTGTNETEAVMTKNHLDLIIQELKDKLQQKGAEYREYEQTLMALHQMADGGSRMGELDGFLNSLTEGPVGTPALQPSALDFSRCRNTNDRLIVVAQANDGIVQTRQATNVLWAVRPGAGTFDSLLSNVRCNLSSRRSDWERISTGKYRYRRYVPADPQIPDNAPPQGSDEPTQAPSLWFRPTSGPVKTAKSALAYPNLPSYSAGTTGAARRAAGRAAPTRVRTGTGTQLLEIRPGVADFGFLRPSKTLPAKDTHQYILGGLTGQSKTNILLGIPNREVSMINTLMPSALPTALGPLDPDDGDARRQQLGMAIAAMVPIRRTPMGFRVPSQSGNGSYVVTIDGDSAYCSCDDFEKGRYKRPCKHIYGVWFTLQREGEASGDSHPDGTNGTTPPAPDSLVVPPSGLVLPAAPPASPPVDPPSVADLTPPRPTYTQDWPLYYAGQAAEGEQFFRLLRALCDTVIPEIPRGGGRPRLRFPDIVYAAALKVYSGFPTMRGTWVQEYAHEKGYLDHVPSSASIWRYMEDPTLFPWIYLAVVESAKPLGSMETDFAPDSSGFASSVYERWFEHKWGRTVAETRWIKLHLMAGLRTHIVVAAEATDKPTADSPYLPGFLRIAVENFDNVENVVADKGYLSRANYRAIHDAGAKGYIPFKTNSTPGPGLNSHHKPDPLWAKMFYLYHSKHEEFDRVYHKRSNVETVFSQIKARFGSSLRSRLPDAQVNETMFKVLCHNICMLNKAAHELGCTEIFGPQPFG